MAIQINIQNKQMYLISAIVVFMLGVGFVIGQNPLGTGGDPTVMGHSLDEVSAPAGCLSFGGKLVYDNSDGNWSCDTSSISYGFDCITVTDASIITGGESDISCASGTLTGGGCVDVNNINNRLGEWISRPGSLTDRLDETSWTCHSGSNSVKAVARCCELTITATG